MSTDDTGTATLSDQVIEEILGLMGKRRINKAEMARRLRKKQDWVGRRLNGHQRIDVEDLQQIAVVLGVSASDLLPRNSVWKNRPALGERVVATVGEQRSRPRVRTHRPGRPVRQTRPIGQSTRPVTAVAVGR